MTFVLKPGKTKTIKMLKIKKSKLSKKHRNLDLRNIFASQLSMSQIQCYNWSAVVKARKKANKKIWAKTELAV